MLKPDIRDLLTSRDCHDAINDIWHQTYAWEEAHSNSPKLWAKEPDPDGAEQAYALLEADPSLGFQKYLQLAEQGSIWSMIAVAKLYRDGIGVERDVEQAGEWFRRAISSGSWIATRNYAQLLADRGDLAASENVLVDGVAKNWTPAFFWLAWYRHKRKGLKNYQEIKSLLEHAAKQGHPYAQLMLASLMMRGKFGFRSIVAGYRMSRELPTKIGLAQRKPRNHK